MPFSCAALFLYDEETDTLRCRFATGTDADIIQQIAVRSGEGLTGWVARNRRALVNARPSADLEAAGLGALHTEPAVGAGLPAAVQATGSSARCRSTTPTPAFYRDDHRRLLDRVSEQAAAVINNSMLFEQTQEDSLTDPLTGLPNTRFLFMHLTRELARAERLKSEVSLMVMDLDSFKEINDTPRPPRRRPRAVRSRARAARPRSGPTTSASATPATNSSSCSRAAAPTRRSTSARSCSAAIDEVFFEARPGRRVPLGISVGAAVFPQDGESYESLLATADSRMYQDKAARKRRGFTPQAATPRSPRTGTAAPG